MDVVASRRLGVCTVQSKAHFEELIVTIDVVESVFDRVDHHLGDCLGTNFDLFGLFSISRVDGRLLGLVNEVFIWRGFERPDCATFASQD